MDFDYEVIRSDRKTVGLQVTRDGRVFVRVPRRMSDDDVIKTVEKSRGWIEKNIEKQRIIAENTPTLDQADIARLKARAQAVIPEKVRYYSEIMGLYPQSVKITSAKTRFGSCSGKNRLCFSLYLMQYPDEAVDYVVVHELAHIRHHNHSAQFYRLIERYLPDYKERIKLLKP